MRILIIGAGVTGSLFTSYLVNNREKISRKLKEDVEIKLLARGEKYNEILEKGLKIHHVVQDFTSIDRIPLISSLQSSDKYDAVLIFLRKTQIPPLMSTLKSNQSSLFLFAGNNGTAWEGLVPPLKRQNISLAFPGTGGRREGETIHSVYKKKPKLTAERTKENRKKLRKLRKVFRIAGCRLEMTSSMNAWLNHHLALIIPLAKALSRDGGDNLSLSRDKEKLNKTVMAIKEGSCALRKIGFPRRPLKMNLMLFLPLFIIRRQLEKLLSSLMGKSELYDHCMAAPEEIQELSWELKKLVTPTLCEKSNLDDLLTQKN